MFRKRLKKTFPPGTFLPTPARLMAIMQLCLAFSLLLWEASQPFMGDLFHIKSQLIVYQDLMGINSNKSVDSEEKARTLRNKERFENLTHESKGVLHDRYAFLAKKLEEPWTQKMERLIRLFAYEIPPF